MVRVFLLFVVVACLVIGYRIVSGLFKDKALPESQRGNSNDSHSAGRKAEPEANQSERYYRDVLGVSEADGEQEIRAAYRAQLAKYHPDKVTHLGDEFDELASSRTREIIEAFDYLKNKYGFR